MQQISGKALADYGVRLYQSKHESRDRDWFRSMVDRFLLGRRLSQHDFRDISALYIEFFSVGYDEAGKVAIDFSPNPMATFLIALHNNQIRIGRCQSVDCRNIFSTMHGGSKQKYCSNACRVREYRRRKKVEADANRTSVSKSG